VRIRVPAPVVLIFMLIAACGTPRQATDAEGVGAEPAWFVDATRDTGLQFVHDNGMTGRFYQTEIMGPGAALFDYDGDGDLDVYLAQGGPLHAGAPQASPNGQSNDRLYRNDLVIAADGRRTVRFADVTAASGLNPRGHGMGAAVGDIDNDGWPDLYLTGFGRNQLFRNNGNGTFSDVSRASGTDDPSGWGVSASFFDYDRDGLLDLFVGNYLTYSVATHIPCFSAAGAPDYCRPSVYRPQPSRLYHNDGGGRFSDVTVAAGLAREFGPALGASAADFNADGWPDLFVANDEHENQLWMNRGDGTFTNTALAAGVALGANGERKANMGVDAGDFDADGDDDLFITELINQGSTLYVNDGKGVFEEQSAIRGVRRPSLPLTGFGAAWVDFDNDGWLDVLSVNGLVNRPVGNTTDPFPLGQRKLLLRNTGGRFEDITDRGGDALAVTEASRGAAYGDIDNDGDTDVVVSNGAGPARLLLNEIGASRHWIGVRLVAPAAREADTAHARDVIGAKVAFVRPDGTTLWRRARADGSYASANDSRVIAGLGPSTTVPRVDVYWPDGRKETWQDLALDTYSTLTKGTGR
jgi:enediyne biosynthesis protein E4